MRRHVRAASQPSLGRPSRGGAAGPDIHLIVNADDFNLTEGVSQGIMRAHERGIVTSTSFMVNLPVSARILKDLKQRKKLGVGLHLNITLGKSVTPARKVRTLVDEKGFFQKRSELDFRKIARIELAEEYRNQIELFRRLMGRLPTHLDTHHQLHENKKIFDVLTALAARCRIPVRLSRLCTSAIRKKLKARGVLTTDYLIEDLNPDRAWDSASLLKALRELKKGSYELMCHPAKCDKALMKISSFNRTRERELAALCSRPVKTVLEAKNIRLSTFGDL